VSLQEQTVFANLRAGEMSIHHGYTVHGSRANLSEAPRRAAVLNFMLDGTTCGADEPLMPGAERIPKGAAIEGRFFPSVG